MYTTAHHKIRQQCFEVFWSVATQSLDRQPSLPLLIPLTGCLFVPLRYTHHLAFFFMVGLYTHATGCFVRDSVEPDYTYTFPYYSTEHCLGYESWRL